MTVTVVSPSWSSSLRRLPPSVPHPIGSSQILAAKGGGPGFAKGFLCQAGQATAFLASVSSHVKTGRLEVWVPCSQAHVHQAPPLPGPDLGDTVCLTPED